MRTTTLSLTLTLPSATTGPDRVLVLRSTHSDSKERAWEHLSPPLEYLQGNGPLQHASQSFDGNHIAVAGRRGAAIYNVKSHKWRLFGDLSQENLTIPTSLAWCGSALLIACAPFVETRRGTRPPELRWYPSNHLDKASLLHSCPLPKPVCELHVVTKRGRRSFDADKEDSVQLLAHLSDGRAFLYLVSDAPGRFQRDHTLNWTLIATLSLALYTCKV